MKTKTKRILIKFRLFITLFRNVNIFRKMLNAGELTDFKSLDKQLILSYSFETFRSILQKILLYLHQLSLSL